MEEHAMKEHAIEEQIDIEEQILMSNIEAQI